jgi:hypothetical protein
MRPALGSIRFLQVRFLSHQPNARFSNAFKNENSARSVGSGGACGSIGIDDRHESRSERDATGDSSSEPDAAHATSMDLSSSTSAQILQILGLSWAHLAVRVKPISYTPSIVIPVSGFSVMIPDLLYYLSQGMRFLTIIGV